MRGSTPTTFRIFESGSWAINEFYIHRWEDNIKNDLIEIEYVGMDWIDLAQDRDQWRDLVNTVISLQHQ
jgi:hypothetical protein